MEKEEGEVKDMTGTEEPAGKLTAGSDWLIKQANCRIYFLGQVLKLCEIFLPRRQGNDVHRRRDTNMLREGLVSALELSS